MSIPQSTNPAKAAFSGSSAHPYVQQMALVSKPRFQRINDHRYLTIIESDANPAPRIPITVETSGEHILVVAGPQSQKFSRQALSQSDRILAYLGLQDDNNRVFEQMCNAFAKAHEIDAETLAATEREAAERAERLATIRRNGNGRPPAGWQSATPDEIAAVERQASGRPQDLPITASSQAERDARRERHDAALGTVARQIEAARASLNGALKPDPANRRGNGAAMPTAWRARR